MSLRYGYHATSPERSLTAAINDASPDFILPCDDRAVTHLHRLHSSALASGSSGLKIAALIRRSLGAPDSFPIVSSRGALLHLARAENIPVPETQEIASVDDLRSWNGVHDFPWVMKIDGSWGGLGVRVVRSLREAEDCFRLMNKPLGTVAMLKRLLVNRDAFWIEPWRHRSRPGITVQTWIEGRPANCVVFCREGQVQAGITVEVVAAQGTMGPATIVRIVDDHQMLKAAATLARRLNLSGIHGLDFMLENKTGTAYLVELNPRCAMPCHLRLGPGRDLIGALCSELSGIQVNPAPFVPHCDTVAYFPQAWFSDPQDQWLRSGYHDVPWEEPDLVKELMLLPWPDRSFLARTSDRLRKMTFEERGARRRVFEAAPRDQDSRTTVSDAAVGAPYE